MMSRRDFEAVADVLKEEAQVATTEVETLLIREIAEKLADAFRRSNAQFNRNIFMRRIGL